MKSNLKEAINIDGVENMDGGSFVIGVDNAINLNNVIVLSLIRTIQKLEHKINDGRIKDKDAEKIKVEYFKAYINAINCFNNISKNNKLDFDKEIIKEYLNKDMEEA